MHIQVSVLQHTAGPGYDTVDTDGIECKTLVVYNLTYDPRQQMWLGGRADAGGPTFTGTSLAAVLEHFGDEIVRSYY